MPWPGRPAPVGQPSRQRLSLDLTWRTIVRVLLAAALVWCALRLAQVLLSLVVAVLVAVLLEPVVCWLERRGLKRWGAAAVVSMAMLLLLGGFVWMTWSTLSNQSQFVAGHLARWQEQVGDQLPSWVRSGEGPGSASSLASFALRTGRSAVVALALVGFGLIVGIYLLMDGRRTYRWLLAFVPRSHRPRVEQTVAECRGVVFDYMAGNVITSVIAAVATWVVLAWLGVPAALLLALLAGISDFVPVIGFFLTAIPAVLLALTVSPTTALIVAVFYLVYNAVETYLIAPRVYGDRMKLSDLAVLLAFAVGAQLGGVIGALIALPIAAIYPTIERLWLREQLPDETLREHRAIENSHE